MICQELARAVTRKRALLFFISLMGCLISGGCLAPRRGALLVPGQCLKIGAESFTQPCIQRADGKLVCNGVVVTANCVAPLSDRHR
jgi:hypothetical protein